MIISANSGPNRKEFDFLLKSTVSELNTLGKKPNKMLSELAGKKLEPFVEEIMKDKAKGSPFENSIELISAFRFPDIVAKKYYGVEVKSTTQNHWKTTGNSVLESTRVEGVERIFILFGKLASPVEFKCRPYEDCLSEVVVTHSPRFLIDMNLEIGKTIFDKIEIPYDVLRKGNPISSIKEYYKSLLKKGEDLWWIDQNVDKPSSLVIKIWNNLNKQEKQIIRNKAMIYFPEVFSNSTDKFGRLAIWLITNEGIVCPNIRDLFTAGGKGSYVINKKRFINIPRIFITLFDNIEDVKSIIENTSSETLSEFWNYKTKPNKKINDWISLINQESKKIRDASHLPIDEMLSQLLIQ